MRMTVLLILFLGLVTISGCEKSPTLAPTPQLPPPNSSTSPSDVIAVYRATITASVSCAAAIPAMAQERTYTATLHSSGMLQWAGPTLNSPPGHNLISSGTLA